MAESNSKAPPVPMPLPQTAPKIIPLDGALVFLMIVWGANFVVLKSTGELIGPLTFNALRFMLGAVVLGILFTLGGVKLILPREEWRSLICIALISDVYQVLFVTALNQTSVANSALILTTTPVWVVLINAWRGHERVRRGTVLGVLMALGGVLIVILARYADKFSFGGDTLPGDLMTMGASLLWAAIIMYSRRPLQRNPTIPASFWLLLWGTVFNVLFAIPDMLNMDWSRVSMNVFWASCYSGVISIGIGTMIWNRGVQKLGTSRTAIYTYLEPVVAAIVAIIFLKEAFSIWLVVGTILVFGGVLLVKKG